MRERMLSLRLLALCAAIALGSCGYSAGVRLPAGYATVGVSVFDNAGPEPRVERDFFASLSNQASRMLDAELQAPDRADLVIRGLIVDYRRVAGVLSSEGELQQSGVGVSLQAWIEDRKLGQRLGEAIFVDQVIRYVVRAGEEERGARRQALDHLAQELVLDLFNQVSYAPTGEGAEAKPEVPEPPIIKTLIETQKEDEQP